MRHGRKKGNTVFKGSEIHKSLRLAEIGILMAPDKKITMDIKGTR